VFDRGSSTVTIQTIVATVSVFGLEFWGHLLRALGTQNTLISPQLEHGVGLLFSRAFAIVLKVLLECQSLIAPSPYKQQHL